MERRNIMSNENLTPEQREIAELKARLAAIENAQGKTHTNTKKISFDAGKAKEFVVKNKKPIIIAGIVIVLVVAILATCISLIGLRGVYVNVDNPYDSYVFTASKYEARSKDSADGGFVEKGKWKKSKNTLTLSLEDEFFGKLELSYELKLIDGYKKITIDDKTYERISLSGWKSVAGKDVEITFDLNGGVSEEPVENKTYKFLESVEYNPPKPTRADGKFMGWYDSKDGYKVEGNKPYKYGKPAYKDVTYYANWLLHEDCPGHEYGNDCVCITCGKTNHTLDSNCVCSVCGVTAHTVQNCECTNCHSVVHNLSAEGVCSECNWSIFEFELVDNGYRVKDVISKATITIPSTYNNLPVTSIGDDAFSGCTSLTSITIPNSVTSIGDDAFAGCTSLTSITIPNSVTSIGDGAFAYCDSLTSVTIGNSVTSIGRYAFRDCDSLTSITIPNSVTSIGDGVFYDCTSLTSITIPNSVTSIGSSAFAYCESLTSVTIPNSVTSIGDDAFRNCTSLTSVTIGNSVTSIGNSAFSGCDALTSVTIPNSVTSIGDYAFSGCDSLTSVTIPNSVTSIGDGAFAYCDSLTSVTIGNSVTSIGRYAFRDCDSLTSITFEDTTDWYRTTSETDWQNKTGGTLVDVTNPTNNDELFVDNYYNYYWYKK